MMTPIQMKRAYEEHRKIEEARDLDAVVATFADHCFLEGYGRRPVDLGRRMPGQKRTMESHLR